MTLDYETLRLAWWLFLTVLLTGFAVLDGFDLGVAGQLFYVARTDTERRVAINSIAPVWEGNQIWFVLGGGAAFAAFPLLYATAFSGFYYAMFVVLLALILRPVGFDFRNKLTDPRWRRTWDIALTIAGVVPALVFGVGVGNLLLGAPFSFDPDMRLINQISFFGLLTPFALLCGLVSLGMLLMHGAAYLRLKTEGRVADRAGTVLTVTGLAVAALMVAGGLWIAWGIDGYRIAAGGDPYGPSAPMAKTVVTATGAWLSNYQAQPWTLLAPALAVLMPLAAVLLTRMRRDGLTFLATTLAVIAIIATAAVSLFPFLLPSSLEPSASLTIWDASSSRTTLKVMFFCTLFFLPIVGLYTSWVYRVLKGRIGEDYIKANSKSLY
jgi:cytochrome d ubiquinol oxidase subunit II